MKTNSYLRGRIEFIKKQRANNSLSSLERKLLSYGLIVDEQKHNASIQAIVKENSLSSEPLSFLELSSYNTFFTLHPEKVCGKEVLSTSLQFSITIKGTKEDIIQTIHQNISKAEFNMEAKTRKEKALHIKKLLLGSSWYEGFQGLDGIKAEQELGALGESTSTSINDNLRVVDNLLQEDQKYSSTDKLSFEQVVSFYNKGISNDEIKA